MKKFLFILSNFAGGGGERAHIMLANGISESPENIVHLLVAKSSGPNASLVSKKVKIVDLGTERSLFSIYQLRKHIKRINPDVICSALVIPNIITAAATIGLPIKNIFAIEHGDINESYAVDKHKISARIGYNFAKYFYKKFKKILCVDESTAVALSAFFKYINLPIEIVPNAVIDAEKDAMRLLKPVEHKFFQANYTTLLNIGRLADQKDQEKLINAVSYMISKSFNVKLIILGEGPLREKLQRQINDLGLTNHIDLAGYHDPLPFLNRSKLLVMSSKWEALPTTIIESLYCKTPVVTTVSSMGTLKLTDYGQCAYICTDNTHIGLAEKIMYALNSESINPLNKEHMQSIAMKYEKSIVASYYEKIFLSR